jgi:pimeloyl-ACP methyl ester carboxylesterase
MMQAAPPMPHLLLPRSPLVPGRSPVRIGYRDSDDGREFGRPDVLVARPRGRWGARIYSFDRQIAALDRHRVIVPDRTGYGTSETIDVQPVNFTSAAETLAVLDAAGAQARLVLGTQRRRRDCLQSRADGARSSGSDRRGRLLLSASPDRACSSVVRDRPRQFGGRVSKALEIDHGSRWRALLTVNGEAWLHLVDSAGDAEADLYDGRLADVRSPVLLVHGEADRGLSLENSMHSVPRFRTQTLAWLERSTARTASPRRPCGHGRRAALSRVTRF